MLLILAEYLSEYFSAVAVFQYLTFRGILGVLTALGLSLFIGPRLINYLKAKQIRTICS